MCGIAGIWGGDRHQPEDLQADLTSMLEVLAHRGPDGAGIFLNPRGGLAHVRLAIIDIATGQQPMGKQNLWITYNGEVFNYLELRRELESEGLTFSTHCDTEVVLKAYQHWGSACLQKFNGQYAFAIADTSTGELFLARDPFGERPLYYTLQRGQICFASEIKSLLTLSQVERQLDMLALRSIAGSWTTQPEQTCFAGIRQLAPGTWLRFKDGLLTSGQHYHLPLFQEQQGSAEELREHLQKSVQLRLRSDVPVGTYLSGGLDSSITTAIACQNLDQVHSFSVSFSDPAYDESSEQQLASQYLGTQHVDVRVSEEDIANIFPKVVYHAECAQFRTALAPLYLLAQEVRQHDIKVVLTGEGADEIFMGYNIYKETLLRQALPNMNDDEAAMALSKLYPYLPHFNAKGARQQLPMFRRSLQGPPSLFSHQVRFSNSQWCEGFLKVENTPNAQEQWFHTLQSWPDFEHRDALGKAQELERLSLLGGYLLSSQGDRMGMAHGLEARCPFLDPHVVAYGQSLRLSNKLKNDVIEKDCLKEAYKNSLPSQIIHRPKQPYRAMEAQCFTKSKTDWYRELRDLKSLNARDWLNAKKADLLFNKAEISVGELSPRENQALVMILSTMLLEDQLIKVKPRGSGLNIAIYI